MSRGTYNPINGEMKDEVSEKAFRIYPEFLMF